MALEWPMPIFDRLNVSQFIHVTREGAVVLIGINRPEKKNALTAEMYKALADALYAAAADEAVRVVLLHGEGGCFTAGNDLGFCHPTAGCQRDTGNTLSSGNRAFQKAAGRGGGGRGGGLGTTMLLHCDLVYATPQTRFALPFVNLAVVPEAASSYLLPRIAGWQRAAEMLMLGEPVSAEQALAAGMINAIVSPDRLMEIAMAAASKLASKPPLALRETKRLMKQADYERIDSALRAEARVFAQCLQSQEAREAFAAFFEKRKPDFSRF